MTSPQQDLRSAALSDPSEAEGRLRDLLQRCPEVGEYHLWLGIALIEQGRALEAVPVLEAAGALAPENPEVWRKMSAAQMLLARPLEAARSVERELRASSRLPHMLRAGAALARNDIPVAERLLKALLKSSPDDVSALRMLAEVAGRLGRWADARALLEHGLSLAPSFREARYNLAIVLLRQQHPVEALTEQECLLDADPENPTYRNLRAAALAGIGDLEGAVVDFKRVLATRHDQAAIWMNYGHALKTAGEQSAGVSAYRRAIELEPRLGEAWWSLANLKAVEFDEIDVAAMQDGLRRSDLRDGDALHFHFALGKAFEDRLEFAASFEHYQAGNRLRRAVLDYNPDHISRKVTNIVAALRAGFLGGSSQGGCRKPDPIFIVGLPRSGSTLVEQILASHPLIEGTQELPEMPAIAREAIETAPEPYPARLLSLSDDHQTRLGELYLERTRPQRKRGTPLFIDKMPNNWINVPLILKILPNAKVIDARRDPLACGFSNFKQHFARGQNFSYDLREIGLYYNDYLNLMEAVEQTAPGRVLLVEHEKIVNDTQNEVRTILDFIGVDYVEDCLRFFENKRAVRTASSEQVRRPIFREGLDQWRNYESWLGPLKSALSSRARPDV